MSSSSSSSSNSNNKKRVFSSIIIDEQPVRIEIQSTDNSQKSATINTTPNNASTSNDNDEVIVQEEASDKGNTCIICSEDWKALDPSHEHAVVSLSCGHIFGKKCILKWIQEKQKCPFCQKNNTISSIFQLNFKDTIENSQRYRERLEKQRLAMAQAEQKRKREQHHFTELNSLFQKHKSVFNYCLTYKNKMEPDVILDESQDNDVVEVVGPTSTSSSASSSASTPPPPLLPPVFLDASYTTPPLFRLPSSLGSSSSSNNIVPPVFLVENSPVPNREPHEVIFASPPSSSSSSSAHRSNGTTTSTPSSTFSVDDDVIPIEVPNSAPPQPRRSFPMRRSAQAAAQYIQREIQDARSNNGFRLPPRRSGGSLQRILGSIVGAPTRASSLDSLTEGYNSNDDEDYKPEEDEPIDEYDFLIGLDDVHDSHNNQNGTSNGTTGNNYSNNNGSSTNKIVRSSPSVDNGDDDDVIFVSSSQQDLQKRFQETKDRRKFHRKQRTAESSFETPSLQELKALLKEVDSMLSKYPTTKPTS